MHSRYKGDNTSELSHCQGKSAMEALQTWGGYLGKGRYHEESISLYVPRFE